ncbi:PDZ domain-containing protein [Oceanobacillus limi]|uniref:PDZ domain-containing protein n=1 Tax=Oceanobacillus limi TaxID=930131 RepID=UPI001FCD0DD9|nr:PDZ domain-containing protein [Oceanobacillus limi]
MIEVVKGIGRVFLNPLLYWVFLLMTLVGYRRIKRDRLNFGVKVFNLFSEWKDTWLASMLFGLFISLLMVGVGFVFSYETLILLSVVVILLSLFLRFGLLSASYSIGITYLLLLLMPTVMEYQTLINKGLFSEANFTGLSILMGLFLIFEAQQLRKTDRNETFPELIRSSRGAWIGQHRIKKLSVIPFFTLVPAGLITPFAPYWPYITIGGEAYSLILIPFLIGFEHLVKGSLPHEAGVRIAKAVFVLALLVTAIAIGSVFISWLSIVAIVVGIIGREIINYRHRIQDNGNQPYFRQVDNGLQILSIIPGSPADRLNILIGEMITKVNGQKVSTEKQFYEALQETGAFFKMEVIDDAGEVRFVQSALYEGDHHELGLIFITKPYRNK